MLNKIFEFVPIIFVNFPHSQQELKTSILNIFYHFTVILKTVYKTLFLELAVLIFSVVCEIRGCVVRTALFSSS
jgi:hypothetical protein